MNKLTGITERVAGGMLSLTECYNIILLTKY